MHSSLHTCQAPSYRRQTHLAQAGSTLSLTSSGCAGRYVIKAASSSAAAGNCPSWPSSCTSCCSHRLRSPDSFPSKSAQRSDNGDRQTFLGGWTFQTD